MTPKGVTIRRPAVAGMFYPGSREELERDVRAMLFAAPRVAGADSVIGIIAPHAGYMYSGPTAAHAYAQIAGSRRDLVVVVSPSHRNYFDGVSVFPGDAYATPLGVVPVATDVRARLVKESLILMSTAGHGEEHALEVQLPFLQCALGEFSLLPLVTGTQSRQECFALGRILGMTLKDASVLLVASTDLSHFHTAATAMRLDDIVARDLAAFDADQLMSDLESGRAEACGGGPAVAVMLACHRLGARSLRVVHRTHSGEITGDNSGVVGYLSAIIQLPGTAAA